MDKGKIFSPGRSQTVRLPKEFRFDSEVRIRRDGGAVILEPISTGWDWLEKIVGSVDDDFANAAAEKPNEQARPVLDFFK